jgi:large subunit ribosomal protein L37Ae
MVTKKVSSAGRFGVRYGKKIRERVISVEKKQRLKQKCPYCSKLTAKRVSKGIWTCKSCKKKFASNTYYLGS